MKIHLIKKQAIEDYILNNARSKVSFGNHKIHLFVKWIGTHSEYTRLCNEGKQYSINIY